MTYHYFILVKSHLLIYVIFMLFLCYLNQMYQILGIIFHNPSGVIWVAIQKLNPNPNLFIHGGT